MVTFRCLFMVVPVCSIFGIDDLAVGLIGGALVGGVTSLIGAKKQNSAAAAQAQQAQQFTADQTGTAYQRAVLDMEKAGLNPMLAYSQGGAGAAQGQAAPVVNELGGAANSAADVLSQLSSIRLQNAQADQARTQSAANAAAVPRIAAEARSANASAAATEYQVSQLLPIEKYKRGYELGKASLESTESQARLRALTGTTPPVGDSRYTPGDKAAVEALKGQVADSLLTQYQVPGARNEAQFQSGFMGRAMPYAKAFGDVFGTASRVFSYGRGKP